MLQNFNPAASGYDVVIVGAGITGLTAAIMLAERSSKSILVIEGDDTIGGRAKSAGLDNGLKVDEGAHWFHGADDNPFFRWANDRYRLRGLVNDTTEGRRTIWGDRIDPEGSLRKAFNRLDRAYEKFARDNPDGDISLRELARMSGGNAVREAAEFMATEWMARDSSHQISSKEYFADPLGPGGWQLKGGMDRLTWRMAQEAMGRGVQIRTGALVSDIRDLGPEAQLTLASGETLRARDCLVTVSAGVIKNRGIAFEPRIDDTAREAVRSVAMGHMTKLILPIRESFFEERGIRPDTRIYMIESGYFVHARSAGEPAITIFRGGTPAFEMESMGQKKLARIASRVLSKISEFDGYEAQRDGRIRVTGWGNNPLTRGSYSIAKPHRSRSDPFSCGRISFAGEAFVARPQESPGQMPAAWLSASKIVPELS